MELAISTSTLNVESGKAEPAVVQENLLSGEQKTAQKKNTLKAALLVVSGVFLYCIYLTFVKLASKLNAGDQTAIRFTVQGVLFFAICKYKRLNVFGDSAQSRKYLLLFGLCTVLPLLFGTIAVQYVSVSDTITLVHSAIIFTAILCRVFLKEKLTMVIFVSFLITATGVVFISRPSFIFGRSILILNETMTNSSTVPLGLTTDEYNQYMGVGLSLLVAVMLAFTNMILRKLAILKVHFSVVNIFPVYFGVFIGIAYSAVLVLTGYSHRNISQEKQLYLLHFGYSVTGTVFGVVGITLVNLAFSYEDGTKVAIMRTSDVIFSFIIQYLVLSIKPSYLSIIGALLILVSTLLLIISKIFEAKFKQSCCLKWLVRGF